MKHLVLSLALSLAMVGCGEKTTPSTDKFGHLYASNASGGTRDSLFGLWKYVEPGRDISVEYRLEFSTNQMTSAARCTRTSDGMVLTVGITIPVEITATHVVFKAAAKDQAVDGNMTCTANATNGGKLPYQINGLTLLVPGADDDLALSKVRD